MARSPQESAALIVGDLVLTPDGPGIFLGLATYEVIQIGVHAGRRRYVWTDAAYKMTLALHGPYAVGVVDPADPDPAGYRFIRGYTYDQIERDKP